MPVDFFNDYKDHISDNPKITISAPITFKAQFLFGTVLLRIKEHLHFYYHRERTKEKRINFYSAPNMCSKPYARGTIYKIIFIFYKVMT